MWTLLVEQGSLEPVYRTLLEEYDVDAVTLEHDLIELVDKLAEQGLLSVSD